LNLIERVPSCPYDANPFRNAKLVKMTVTRAVPTAARRWIAEIPAELLQWEEARVPPLASESLKLRSIYLVFIALAGFTTSALPLPLFPV
jgi:hypothetical protein